MRFRLIYFFLFLNIHIFFSFVCFEIRYSGLLPFLYLGTIVIILSSLLHVVVRRILLVITTNFRFRAVHWLYNCRASERFHRP